VAESLAFGKDAFLNVLRQTNVAVAMPMNMHKHSSSDEKGIFVDSRVGPLCHTREGEDPLTEFLMKLFSRFHVQRLARKIICLTIQTTAKFDNRTKSGALTKMSFSLDIAQDNTGGPAGMKYQRIHPLQCLRLVCVLGSSQNEDNPSIKPRREMRDHLPTLRQNHHSPS
jgi:hypothetical protein